MRCRDMIEACSSQVLQSGQVKFTRDARGTRLSALSACYAYMRACVCACTRVCMLTRDARVDALISFELVVNGDKRLLEGFQGVDFLPEARGVGSGGLHRGQGCEWG